MADEINKPIIDPAEQDVLMREMFKGTSQPPLTDVPAMFGGQNTTPGVPAMFGDQSITPVRQTPVVTRGPMIGPITAGMDALTGIPTARQNVNPMPVNLGGQNISPRGPIPRMQEGGPVQEGGMPMPPGGMPTGETANAGIMEGFNPNQQALAEKIATDFNSIRNHEDIMNMIRGDEKTIEERKAELADVVGEEDAEATPDSSLTITQFGMKQITEANQALEQGEEPEGIASLPEGQEAIDMDQGALMGAQPEVPQVPETVMPGMAFGGMVQRYAYGGEVTREGVPVQRFFPGGFALIPPIAGTVGRTAGVRALTKAAKPFLEKVKGVGKGFGKRKEKVIDAKWEDVGKKGGALTTTGAKTKDSWGKLAKDYWKKGVIGAGALGATGWLGKKLLGDKDDKDDPLTGLNPADFSVSGKDGIDPNMIEDPDERKAAASVYDMPYEDLLALSEKRFNITKDWMDKLDDTQKQKWLAVSRFGLRLAGAKGGKSLTQQVSEAGVPLTEDLAALSAQKVLRDQNLLMNSINKTFDFYEKVTLQEMKANEGNWRERMAERYRKTGDRTYLMALTGASNSGMLWIQQNMGKFMELDDNERQNLIQEVAEYESVNKATSRNNFDVERMTEQQKAERFESNEEFNKYLKDSFKNRTLIIITGTTEGSVMYNPKTGQFENPIKATKEMFRSE